MSGRGVAIVAEGLSVRGPEGAVVRGIDLDARPGSLTVLAGPAGSGRTALMLALGARFTTSGGRVTIDGTDLPRGAKQARRRIAVARATPAIELEERLTVGELAAERRAIGGPRVTAESLADAYHLVDLALDPHARFGALPRIDQLLLALALAAAEQPGGVLVDDVDSGIAGSDLERAWFAVRALAHAGTTVVATATAPPPPGPAGADLVVALPDRPAPTGARR